MPSPVPKRAWFKEPLVWMLIAIPASAVVMGVAMFTLATGSYDGLVADDYYQRGLQINRSLERDRTARRLGLQAEIVIEDDSGNISVTLRSDAPLPPQQMQLKYLHATRQGQDLSVELVHAGASRYTGTLPVIPPDSNAYLRLEAPDWRLSTRLANSLKQGQPVRLESTAPPAS